MNEVVSEGASSVDVNVAGAPNGRPIVVVVGMHRSGTSLCSQVLNVLGVDIASDIGAHESNLYGHYERWEIMELQDEILALFDRRYFTPMHDFPLPPAWWADLRVRPIKEKIKAFFKPFLEGSALFGFKDPRTTRLMPLWNQIFVELGLRPKFIVCIRDPAHVAESLRTRDNLDPLIGELRAVDYMVDALRYTRGRDRCLINYEDWLDDPRMNASRLLGFIDPTCSMEISDLDVAINSVFHSELNRAGKPGIKARQPIVRTFYDIVSRFAHVDGADKSLAAQIESFTHNYIAFRQLLHPFESQFKIVAKASAEESQQLSSVRQLLESEQAALTELRESHAPAEARATHAEQEAAHSRATIDELNAVLQSERLERTQLLEAYAIANQRLSQADDEAQSERECATQLRADRMSLLNRVEQAEQLSMQRLARTEELEGALRREQAELQRIAEALTMGEQSLNELQRRFYAETAMSAQLGEALALATARADQAEQITAQQTVQIAELTGASQRGQAELAIASGADLQAGRQAAQAQSDLDTE